MSQQLIDRSPDLKRLQEEGFEVEVKDGVYLLVKNVPYVNSQAQVKLGTLVSPLKLAGDEVAKPDCHIMYFAGEHPCNVDGSEISKIKHSSAVQVMGITVNHSFSSKPRPEGYHDYYEKMATYAAILYSQAQVIDPKVTAKTFAPVAMSESESVFNYRDTATSRAGIGALTKKLEVPRVAIVGMGGTGAYLLDLIAKTPIKEIHLFDDDILYSHNAFRSPGAADIEQLRTRPKKVCYFQDMYSKMRKGIVAHDYKITEENVHELCKMDFIFLCIDSNSAKKIIIERLDSLELPFIDVGMGVQLGDDALTGIVRVTTSSKCKRDHVKSRVSLADADVNNEYASNIQIADLNALNATLAVIKWKKLCGFYLDVDKEHSSNYTIDGNHLLNEDKLCEQE